MSKKRNSKFCKKCKHYRPIEFSIGYKLQFMNRFNMSFGEIHQKFKDLNFCLFRSENLCGSEGEYFEPTPEEKWLEFFRKQEK